MFGFVGACASARTVSCASPITFQLRPASSLWYTPPPPEYSVHVLAYNLLESRGSTRMWVTTSSCPVPILLSSCQCAPSSLELNTCPSEVPKYSFFQSWESASSEITVPPGGPTCRQVCAGAETAATAKIAKPPSHFPVIGMLFSQSAGALTSIECRESGFPGRLF